MPNTIENPFTVIVMNQSEHIAVDVRLWCDKRFKNRWKRHIIKDITSNTLCFRYQFEHEEDFFEFNLRYGYPN